MIGMSPGALMSREAIALKSTHGKAIVPTKCPSPASVTEKSTVPIDQVGERSDTSDWRTLASASSPQLPSTAMLAILIEHRAAFDARDDAGDTALHHAAWAGSEHVVRFLIAARAEPDLSGCQGETALVLAALRGHVAAAACLLELGATTTMEAWSTEEKPNLTWSHPWAASPGAREKRLSRSKPPDMTSC